jgi:diadenosine tetraphosphate (Ap4A) HIT family hydrolase
VSGSELSFGAWTLKIQRDGAADFKSLPPDEIQELFLIVNYTIA